MSMTARGAELALSAALPVNQTRAAYAALSWTDVAGVEKIGTYGPAFNKSEVQLLKGAKEKHKGSVDYGSLAPVIAIDAGDAGQALMQAASAASSSVQYSLRITLPSGEKRYAQCRVFGWPETVDNADTIITAAPTLEITTKPVLAGTLVIAPPAAITTLAVVVLANGTARLSWTAPASPGAPLFDYTIQYRPASGGAWTTYADPVGTATTVDLSGLPFLLHQFRVLAENSEGLSDPSNVVQALPGYFLAASGLPSAATLARASVGSYFSSAGALAVAAADGARFDHDPNTLAYKGLLLEKASTNYAPHTDTLPFPTWSFAGGGTGVATTPGTLTATASTPSPDGSNADPGQGVTCTGFALDTVRNILLLGNAGINLDGVATGNGITAPSIVMLNPTTLAKVGEHIIPAPYAINGLQSVLYDTVTDLYGYVVPSSQFIRFFHPVTGAYVSSLAIPAEIVQANGSAYDPVDDLFWVSSNANGTLYAFNRAGVVVRSFKPTNNSSLIPDQLWVRPAERELWFSVDDNTNGGAVYRLSITLDRILGGARCTAAKAIEGVAVIGSNVIVASDGYTHSVPPQSVPAPFNINVLLTYNLAGFAAYQYSRTFQHYGGSGITRAIMNKGSGATTNDFLSLGVVNSYASGSSATKTLGLWLKTRNGENVDIFIRGDATAQTITVTGNWQFFSLTATMASAAQIQIGLRRGGGFYNTADFCDILMRGIQMELGAVATTYIPAESAAATRLEDVLSIDGPSGNYRLTFDNDNTQTLALTASAGKVAIAGSAINRPRVKRIEYLP